MRAVESPGDSNVEISLRQRDWPYYSSQKHFTGFKTLYHLEVKSLAKN